jgi:hypothetical protein
MLSQPGLPKKNRAAQAEGNSNRNNCHDWSEDSEPDESPGDIKRSLGHAHDAR